MKLIKGSGVDIIEIIRVEKAFRASDRFAVRVFTQDELAYCLGRKKNRWASLAARFAAKEAVAKALGTGFGRVRLKDIVIVTGESGKPTVSLYGEAAIVARQMKIEDIKLSLSHCREYAIAFAVIY